MISVYNRSNEVKDLFDLLDFPTSCETYSGAFMRTDILENDKEFRLLIEVPAVKKEDIKVSLDKHYLTVEIVKRNYELDKESNEKYLSKERFTGTYKRSYYVGEYIANEDISAELTDGILALTIRKPIKKEDNESKYIEVK